MRCDQMIGYNKWAKEYLKGKDIIVGIRKVTEQYYDDGRVEEYTEPIIRKNFTVEVYGEFEGFNVYPLHRYTFDDGRVVEEYLQAQPWSSGPIMFMALRDTKTQVPILESLWSEEEIKSYL